MALHSGQCSSLMVRLRRLAEPLCREVFALAGGTADIERRMMTALAEDPVLRDALAVELLRKAVAEVVDWAERRNPASAYYRPSRYAVEEADRLIWRMRGGRLLRDATRPQVIAESQRQFSKAREHLDRAKWLKAIAAKLPDDETTVGTVLTERELRELERVSSQVGLGQQAPGRKFASVETQ